MLLLSGHSVLILDMFILFYQSFCAAIPWVDSVSFESAKEHLVSLSWKLTHFSLPLSLVALDSALEIAASGGLGEKNQLWPRVCGVIAYDTPVSREDLIEAGLMGEAALKAC